MCLVVVATLGTKGYIMACSANHSKGSGSAVGAGLIVGQAGWLQRKINLRPQHRGVHLVTEEILRQVQYNTTIGWIKRLYKIRNRCCNFCD